MNFKINDNSSINNNVHPRNYSFLEYFVEEKDEEKKEGEQTKLFLDISNTEIAMDNSGSTSGAILKKCKQLMNTVFNDNEHKEDFLNNILAWNYICTKMKLDDITSGGGTRPSCIFPYIKSDCQNLLMTTDGQIYKPDLEITRTQLSLHPHIKNVVAIMVMDEGMPQALNLSVFHPFLEHTQRMGGCFYLFCRKLSRGSGPHYYGQGYNSSAEIDVDIDSHLFLLMKALPNNFTDHFPEPLGEFTNETTWQKVPTISFNEIQALKVPTKYDSLAIGELRLKDNKTLINVSRMKELLSKMEKEAKMNILASEEFSIFLDEEIQGLVDQAINKVDKSVMDNIRSILQMWKQVNIIDVEEHIEKLRKECNFEEYEKLCEEKMRITEKTSKEYEEITTKLREISEKIYPSLTLIEELKNEKLRPYKEKFDILMKFLSESENQIVRLNNPSDFTLGNVTKKIANRAKRAEMLVNPDKVEEWNLTGKVCLCEECLICSREDQPCALLMLDLHHEYNDLLQSNLTDEALNDEIVTGMNNVSVIPAGEFCISCAYALKQIGTHPITRQKISSVLVLCDPTKGDNSKLISRSICSSIFGGKAIPASYQILLGLFDQLYKREKEDMVNNKGELAVQTRFSPRVYQYFKNLALNLGKGKLLKEAGESKNLLLAMYDLLNYKFVKTDPETWLTPMRNKTIQTISIICRSLMENIPMLVKKGVQTTLAQVMQKSVELMRRMFIKECCNRIIKIGQKRQKANRYKNPEIINEYNNFIFQIESDLFDNTTTSVPIANSEKITTFGTSRALKALFPENNPEKKNEEIILKECLFFENFVKEVYKKNEHEVNISQFKDFELFPKNLLTLLVAGFYKILTSKNSQNTIGMKEENFLKEYFIKIAGKEKDKSEKEFFQEFSDVFFEGNSGHLKSLTEADLIQLVKRASPYSKLEDEVMNNDHSTFIAQFADHCYSAPVTVCSVCGEWFITKIQKEVVLDLTKKMFSKDSEADIHNLGMDLASIPNKQFKMLEDIAKEVKKKRDQHFQKELGAKENALLPGKNSNMVSYHEIVRKVLYKRRYNQCKKPNRQMIEEELNYARSKADEKKGNIYQQDLARRLLILSADLLKKRKAMLNNFGPFVNRVIFEVNTPEENLHVKIPATMEGMSQDIIDDVLKEFKEYPKSKMKDTIPKVGISLNLNRKPFRNNESNPSSLPASRGMSASRLISSYDNRNCSIQPQPYQPYQSYLPYGLNVNPVVRGPRQRGRIRRVFRRFPPMGLGLPGREKGNRGKRVNPELREAKRKRVEERQKKRDDRRRKFQKKSSSNPRDSRKRIHNFVQWSRGVQRGRSFRGRRGRGWY